MAEQSPPPEVRERLPHEPTLWARNFLRHPEDPTRAYDFYDGQGPPDGEFLWFLVNDDGPMDPENWGDINVLLFARGCLKTSTCTTIAAWAMDCYPTIEFAATAPRDDQRYEVVERFKQKVEQSGLDSRRSKNKLSYQQFKHVIKDEHGNTHTSYSELKSRSAWGEGNALRGIHAHGGIIDEAQDVDEGTFSTFATEAVDRAVPQVDYFPTIFVIGTPKMAHSFFHKLWKMAEKRTWDADEEEWVYVESGDDFLPEEVKERRADLEDELEELREKEHPDETRIEELEEQIESMQGFTVKGWHIDQHNSPLHDPTRIAFKKQTYSKKKFKNEVEAKFYSPENDLIVNDDVWSVLDEDLGFMYERQHGDTDMLLGVDWGGGEGEGAASTVVTVGEMYEDRIEVRNIEVFDSDLSKREEVERIDELMDQYNIDCAVVDEGYGDSERQTLQDEFNHRNLYGCRYGNVKNKEEIKWNRFKSSKRFFTANKPYMVRKFAEDFKDGKIIIPKADLEFGTRRDLGTMVVDQLTAPYTDRDETVTGQKKLRVISDRADDIFDSFNYMWMAGNKVQSNRTNRRIASHERPGY